VLSLGLIFGVPIVALLAWYHGHRAQHRISGPELAILTVLLVIAGTGLWWASRSAREGVATANNPSATITSAMTQPVFAPPAHSVAVLPFVNMSGDPKQEYFSDGVSEELLNALSRLNDLQVMARTSSFSFKGKDADIATIAHKLNVGAILEGSVRRDGNNVRITAQLINTVTGFHLWSQTYDRQFSDIFKTQTEVATAVAQQLEIKLAGNESSKFAVGGTTNPDAYDAYLRAQRLYQVALFGSVARQTQRAALAVVDQAIALDPAYAGAHALRALALQNLAIVSSDADTARGLRKEALASAERAVALAPEFGDAHAVRGRLRCESFDFVGAAEDLERALTLAPGSALVQRLVAVYMGQLGHSATALSAGQRAVTLDPQNWVTYRDEADAFFYARRYREQLAVLQRASELNPGSDELNGVLAQDLYMLGQVEQARQLCEAPRTSLEDDTRHWCLALVYSALGHQADGEHELEQNTKLVGDTAPYFVAELYAQRGDAVSALQWLAKAQRIGDIQMSAVRVDPLFDPIREDPQFKALLARMKYPP
jgi:serine/threonine-protein kinase